MPNSNLNVVLVFLVGVFGSADLMAAKKIAVGRDPGRPCKDFIGREAIVDAARRAVEASNTEPTLLSDLSKATKDEDGGIEVNLILRQAASNTKDLGVLKGLLTRKGIRYSSYNRLARMLPIAIQDVAQAEWIRENLSKYVHKIVPNGRVRAIGKK